MHSTRLLNLLMLGLSAFSAVDAMADARLPVPNGAIVQKRQSQSSSSSSASSTSSPPPTSSSSSSSSTVSSTSSTRISSTSSRTTPPPSSSITPSPTSSSSSTPGSSTSETVQIITSIMTTTDSNGVATTLTTQTTSTSTPGLANNGGNQPSGMSTQTKNTVIGVVVGVGGAIVLGALAFVAWRIWGRKKQSEERDELMEYPNSVGEKPDTGNSLNNRTPFQSTLESYHAPTQVNTASNF